MSALPRRALHVFAGAGILLGAATAAWAQEARPRLPELLAPRVATPPILDGSATDPAWFGAGRLDVPTTGGPTVHLRAVVSGDRLYLLARWPDPTETLGKHAWYFDGTRWHAGIGRAAPPAERSTAKAAALAAATAALGPVPRSRAPDAATAVDQLLGAYVEQDEDRLALLWPIEDSIPEFWRSGCGYACHTEDPDATLHDMWTNEASERADLWHWKSARSNPVQWADDQHLIFVADPTKGGGRRNDPDDTPGYTRNAAAERAAPAFGFPATAPDANRAVLLMENAVPLEEEASPEPGDTVPAYVLARPTGPRGDIRAAGRWADGAWTVELSRALTTGDENDVQFTGSALFPFGVAVMENGGGKVHTTSGPIALRLGAPPGGPRTFGIVAGLLGVVLVVAGVAAARRRSA